MEARERRLIADGIHFSGDRTTMTVVQTRLLGGVATSTRASPGVEAAIAG